MKSTGSSYDNAASFDIRDGKCMPFAKHKPD